MAERDDKKDKQIAVIDELQAGIALVENIQDARYFIDKAEALRYAVKKAGESLEEQNKYAELRLRFERRAGELLIEAGLDSGNPLWSHDVTIGKPRTLSDMGVNKMQSSRWQKIARISKLAFENFLDVAKAKGTEITTAAALQIWKGAAAEEKRSKVVKGHAPVFEQLDEVGTLEHGDMIPILTRCNESFADLILTDPPYGLGENSDIEFRERANMSRSAGDWDAQEVTVPMFDTWAGLFQRAIKPGGSLYCFVADQYIGEMQAALREHDFEVRNLLVWTKPNPPPSVRKSAWRSSVEFIIYATMGTRSVFNFLGQTEMKKHLEYTVCAGNERLDHPCQKPVRLIKHLMQVSSNEGDTVLDPFAGVGTTGAAAMESKRLYYLIERDDYYYKQAYIRIQGSIPKARKVF